jgi:DNA-binding transcriptional LysR family regulator
MSGVLTSRMPDADLNLLTALNALLTEGSVAGAARTLGLSASAMSRTLGRLRAATGDPLLVRAGRGLVPTQHAAALRERVRDLAQEVRAVLQPAFTGLDFARLERIFTVRANDGSWRRSPRGWLRQRPLPPPACACGSRPSPTRTCGRCGRA